MLCLLVTGCGNPQADKLGEATADVAWEPWDSIDTEDYLGGVEMGLDMGDAASAAQAITSAEFKSAVDKIESEGLPSEWSSRDAQRTELVGALRELIAAGESGNRAGMKEALQKVHAAAASLKGNASTPSE